LKFQVDDSRLYHIILIYQLVIGNIKIFLGH